MSFLCSPLGLFVRTLAWISGWIPLLIPVPSHSNGSEVLRHLILLFIIPSFLYLSHLLPIERLLLVRRIASPNVDSGVGFAISGSPDAITVPNL